MTDISSETLRAILEIAYTANSERDLDRLLGLIPREACVLLGADRGTLFLRDSTSGVLRPAGSNFATQRVQSVGELELADLVAASGRPVLLPDASTDPRFVLKGDNVTGDKTRNALAVPIQDQRGKVLGILQLVNKRRGTFVPADEEALRLLGLQVAAALANAQAAEGLRKNLDRLARLMRVGAAISSELDLDALLRVISQTTSHLLQAERSTVFVVDRAKGELWSRVAEGLEKQEIRIPLTRGIAGAVATNGRAVRIPDAYADPRFNPDVDRSTGYRTRDILCVPMRNPQGEILGVFQVLNKQERTFTAEDEELLFTLSSQAAVALENARLYEELQKSYADLKVFDRMKSNFLNAVSHELRTPLAPIIGYTDMLLSGRLGELPPPCQRGIQAIAEGGKRLMGLIESLLAFVRLDQGEVALHRETVPVAPLFEKVMAGFEGRIGERKLVVTIEVPGDLPPVVADVQELRMALAQLVDNAIKFNRVGGAVQLRAGLLPDDQGGRMVEIAVRDTGPGIPPDLHERIFERFYQVDNSATRQYGGVGIGLAVVKQILEAHGSRVIVESEPGKGSTFRFSLPIVR